jgi:Pyridoxamine 5'-phosphate oxidase
VLESLLEGRYIATLATVNEDASIHLTAIWFLHRDGAVYMGTYAASRKVRNAETRPRGSILIDIRGVMLGGATAAGALSVIRGDEARELNDAIARKYLTVQGFDDPAVGGAIRASDDVTIRLDPDRWRTWSTAEDFGGAYERPGTSFPLDV